MKVILLHFLFGFYFCMSTTAQGFDPVLSAQLQGKIDSLQSADNLKGLSACVIHPVYGTWKGTSGISYAGVPIDGDMAFGIGSNTKLFTGVLILKLAERNLLHLDDPIQSYLPPLNHVDPAITIRQLLNHTSGLYDVINTPGYTDSILSNPNRIFTPAEVINWIGSPLYTPGNGWNYSNTNYLLAGLIAESVSGITYSQLLRDSILSPLELDSTYLDVYESSSLVQAHPWQDGADNYSVPRKSINSAAWAAGGMYSTAREMAHWYQALMNHQVLNSQSFNDLTTFVGSAQYGIGIYNTELLGRMVWQHTGTIRGGYNSSMVYDPASGIVICVLVNQIPAQPLQISTQLLATLLSNHASLGVKTHENSYIRIHPNPSSDFVLVKTTEPDSQIISLYSAEGKIILQSAERRIPVSDLLPGVYIISVQSGNSVRKARFIKN